MTPEDFNRLLSRFEDASVALHTEGTRSAQERWEAAGDAIREEFAAERLEARRAQARANEAARLSADARDDVADRDKAIAELHDRIAGLEQDRLDRDAWAVNLAAKHHAGYRERPGSDPFEAIEEALALIPELQADAKRAELTRTRTQDALESAQSAMHRLVASGVRNGEIHRRAARPLLEAVGFDAGEARTIVDAAEEEA